MEAEADGARPEGVAYRVLARQEQLIGWEIADKRAAFGLKVLAGAAALIAASLLAGMIWSASRADGLVIKAFSVPPALAARGVTGEALAAQTMTGSTASRTWRFRASSSGASAETGARTSPSRSPTLASRSRSWTNGCATAWARSAASPAN